jgi:hypothetical protein
MSAEKIREELERQAKARYERRRLAQMSDTDDE